MTALHDQLDRVAERTAGSPVPDADILWTRGHRWRRRRRVMTSAVVGGACAGLLGLGLVGWQTSLQDDLRPASSPAGLPDRVWEPSGTLPGTETTGPLGRLALTMTADRQGWWGSEPGTVGVSAETGRYAFLDLPRQAQESTALSPAGRYLAYWVTGEPSGSPPEDEEAITGFAVYDAESGEVRVQEIETEHGVWADTLTFADDDTLIAQISQRSGGRGDDPMDQASARSAPLWIWHLSRDEATEDLALDKVVRGQRLDGGGHGFVWWVGDSGNVHRVVNVHETAPTARSVPVRSRSMSYTAAVDSSGQRVAALAQAGVRGPVWWGGDSGEEVEVPDSAGTAQVIAWLDASHIVVLRTPSDEETINPGVWVLDIDAGDPREIVSPIAARGGRGDPAGSVLDCCGSRDIAWELATAPTFEAAEPPDPVDRRVLLGGALAVPLVALAGLRGWRRRVQP